MNVISQLREATFCSRGKKTLVSKYLSLKWYSGTLLIRPPLGHGKLVVLTGWSYERGSLNRKMTDQAFFRARIK